VAAAIAGFTGNCAAATIADAIAAPFRASRLVNMMISFEPSVQLRVMTLWTLSGLEEAIFVAAQTRDVSGCDVAAGLPCSAL
jgi:hypothetical protein